MGFDFTVIAPLLPSHCGFFFVFGCGVSFLVSSSVFLSMTAQQLLGDFLIRMYSSTPFLLITKEYYTGRGGGGGMKWEIGIDIYTLICIK